MAGAVVDDAALGGEFEAALLLMLGAALEVAVAEDLQVDEPDADDDEPETEASRREGRAGNARWKRSLPTRLFLRNLRRPRGAAAQTKYITRRTPARSAR